MNDNRKYSLITYDCNIGCIEIKNYIINRRSLETEKYSLLGMELNDEYAGSVLVKQTGVAQCKKESNKVRWFNGNAEDITSNI